MSQLSLIIKTEYLNDVKAKSFWISTILVPILIAAFGIVAGVLMTDSDTFGSMMEKTSPQPDPSEMTPVKLLGMMLGMFLTFFLMFYGAMIFSKVKVEKCNRIMEILSTCVDGKTMMLAKIISVGLVGMTQLLTWGALIIIGATVAFMMFPYAVPWDAICQPWIIMSFVYMLLYFIGGYVLFGSLYACCGAITDKDNENQGYMTAVTFILMGSFYTGEFAVDNGSSLLSIICNYLPLTSPTVGTVNAISGASPVWQTVISLVLLYLTAFVFVTIAGKLYKSSMLLKGKTFSPSDILVFIKAK